MTKPCYASSGCAARSQVSGDAASPVYAWGVNLHNGNANINNRNNEGLALPVSSLGVSPGEYQSAGPVTLKMLYDAWQRARRGKKPSSSQLRFEADWFTSLLRLQQAINSGTWSPRPTRLTIAQRPKAREIHAPDFADRVVHHLIIPLLEALYEPIFIHDSYANRRGKGSHAAVRRVESFARQVYSGEGGGWVLKLDIHNCFNSIHRPTLYADIKEMLVRRSAPEWLQRIVHALLRHSPLRHGVVYGATPQELALVPPHKRLANAAPGCGIAIGNLSSQFLENVYMNELDQFIKHRLRVKRYVRYVDDFVLIHRNREQLLEWKREIEAFLHTRLRLRLKDDVQLLPLSAGIDFLGYVIHPTHSLVRRRVVSHCRESLASWEDKHVTQNQIVGTPAELRQVTSVWRSYQGHFAHARAHRLQSQLQRRFGWLEPLTRVRRRHGLHEEGRRQSINWKGK